MELIIDEDFENILPKRNQQQLNEVESDILRHGITESVYVWNGTIIKGAEIYRIALRHSIDVEHHTRRLDFEKIEQAKAWVIENELRKPHLCAYMRAVLVIKKEELIATQVKQDKDPEKKYTDVRLSEMAKVSVGNIHKVRKIMELATDDDKEKLVNEEISIDKVFTALPKPNEESRKDLSTKRKSDFNVVVVCGDEIEQEKTYLKLCEEGYTCKVSA